MVKNKTGEKFLISDLETLRVIADPLRAQIIELLVHTPQTVKSIAEKLGLAPGKLYYHFNMLEKHGLVEVEETRMVSNMVEKLYRATASSLDVDPSLLQFTTDQGKESIHSLLTSLLDATRDDLARSMQARAVALEQGAEPKPRQVVVKRVTSHIPEARADEFVRRVLQLIQEFDDAGEDKDEANKGLHPYALTVAFYPSYFFEEEKGNGEQS